MKTLVLACSTSVLALAAVPATAQETESDSAPQSNDIVVTGSRLVKDGSQAPTPVTVVTNEALLQTAPSSIPDALNKLPVFANSSNQNTGGTFAATAAAKGNYLNLRALGTQRVLTLLNGSRVVPTTNTNAVDANMLPQMLVSRVDVVTGGASAVYGSDAVSGVVNYVLDEKFTGIKAMAQSGISTHGDDFSYRYGGAFGTSIGDRIHILGSYEHYKSAGIPSLNDRNWAHPGTSFGGGGNAANPYVVVPNATTSVMTYGGKVATGIFKGQRFLPDGTLAPFVCGAPVGSDAPCAGVTQIGGDGVKYTTSMAAKLKTDQAFLRTSFDLTDSIEFFVQGIYGRSESQFNTQAENQRPGSNRNITIFSDNAYLRPELAAQLNAAGESSIAQVGRFFRDIPLMYANTVTDYYSVQAGLKGDLGGSWKWDANYVHGQSKLKLTASEWDTRKFYAAIDAVQAPSGQVVCRITLTDPSFLPGCVPMNVIGEGNVTQAAYDWARSASRYQTTNKMDYVNLNFSGDLIDLPAGPISVAFGAEYRHQSLGQTSNGDPASLSTQAQRDAWFGNIRAVPATALKFLVVNVGEASGSQTVKEAYGELQIPVFKDKPFARNLDLNLAARVTDYKTSGTVVTWKAGGTWTPIDGVRVRVAQSRDIAAPSLYDLYAGANVKNLGVVDPFTGKLFVPQIVNSGNINLDPETANTTTIGAVFSPAAIPGLTASIDAYRIKIKGAIQYTNENTQLSECFRSNGTAPVCDLITRNALNEITAIQVLPQNLAYLTTQGIDFEVSYTTSLDRLLPSIGGTLNLRAFANYLDKYDTQASATQATLAHAGHVLVGYASPGLPKWRGLLSQTYMRDRFTFALTERFTGSYDRGMTEVFASDFPLKSPNRTYVDVNMTYDLSSNNNAQVFLNVQNLFDVTPPVHQFGGAADLNTPTDTAIYDIVGRYFTAGVRVKF